MPRVAGVRYPYQG